MVNIFNLECKPVLLSTCLTSTRTLMLENPTQIPRPVVQSTQVIKDNRNFCSGLLKSGKTHQTVQFATSQYT